MSWSLKKSHPGIILPRARVYAHTNQPGRVISARHHKKNIHSKCYKDFEEEKQVRLLPQNTCLWYYFVLWVNSPLTSPSKGQWIWLLLQDPPNLPLTKLSQNPHLSVSTRGQGIPSGLLTNASYIKYPLYIRCTDSNYNYAWYIGGI